MAQKPITAAELMKQLHNDPKWVEQHKQKQEKFAKLSAIYSADQADLVSEIRSLGYDVNSVWDLVNNAPNEVLQPKFIGSYPLAYPTLIEHLNLPHNDRIKEGILRALTVKDGGSMLESALLSFFKKEQNHTLRWVAANALRTAMPYHRRRKYPEIASTLKQDTYK